jgi:hypothetical protein
MKQGKNFNNISDKLKAEIPKLKKGEKVQFQLLTGMPNPEPDPRERAKQGEVLYGKVQLLTSFRIFDPYQKDSSGNEVGGYIDVGCVDQWLGDTPVKFRLFIPGLTGVVLHNRAFAGRFELQGGSAADEELYEILWLSPERKGSLCQDSSYQIKFEIVDVNATSKGMVNKVDNLRRVIKIVDEMSELEARNIMAALNQPKYQDEKVLMANLKNYAISNVDAFLKTYDSKETPLRSTIKKAMEEKVLVYDLKTGDVKVGGATIATIKNSNVESFMDSFAQWLNTAENGKDVLNNIKNQMENKEEVV